MASRVSSSVRFFQMADVSTLAHWRGMSETAAAETTMAELGGKYNVPSRNAGRQKNKTVITKMGRTGHTMAQYYESYIAECTEEAFGGSRNLTAPSTKCSLMDPRTWSDASDGIQILVGWPPDCPTSSAIHAEMSQCCTMQW